MVALGDCRKGAYTPAARAAVDAAVAAAQAVVDGDLAPAVLQAQQLQQLVAGVVQLQAAQQQMQAAQQQHQQQMQAILDRLDNNDARAHNRHVASRQPPRAGDPTRWVLPAPAMAPFTAAQLGAVAGEQLNELLAHYGLPANGAADAKRERLHRHLGFF